MPHKTKGGALISALFITALAAIIATALAVEERLLIHEGELTLRSDQGYLTLQGVQDSAADSIKKYASQWSQSSAAAAPQQIIALQTKLAPINQNGMTLTGVIALSQGQFNVNDLAYPANQLYFVTLLQSVVPGTSKQQAVAIAQSITAWMTSDADDHYYASLQPPYVSSKNQLVSISELRLIKGVTPDIYTALMPFVTALPVIKPIETASQQSSQQAAPVTLIDINGAAAPVLMAVNPGLNASQAASIVDCRKQHGGFASVQTFMTACVQPSGVANLVNVTAQSQYFSVRTQTIFNHTILSLNSLLVTEVGKNNTLKVRTVWQSFR